MRLTSRFPRVLGMGAVALLVASLGGCLTDDEKDKTGLGDPEFPGRDSVTHALQHYVAAWEKKNITELSALLHDNYEFCPRDEDVADIPWLTGDCWSRVDELAIATNMFDPNFQQGAEAVDKINISVIEQSRSILDAGTNLWSVTCVQQGQVLFSVGNGFSFDTRVLFEFVPDPDEPGLWQIIRQTEIHRT